MSAKRPKLVECGVLLIVFILFFSFFLFNFISINSKYPDRKELIYSIGDEFTYNGISITVVDCNLFDSDDFETEILNGFKSSIWGNELGQWKELLLTIRLDNTTDKICQFDCSSLLIQSESWWNGLDSITFMELNRLESLTIEMEPSSSFVLYFPYNLLQIQFRFSDWEAIMDREFELIGSVYPITQVVKMRANR